MCSYIIGYILLRWCQPKSYELYSPLDEVLALRFLPVLTGQPAFGSAERGLLSLPACLGGLGVFAPTVHFSSSFSSSSCIAAPLIDHLLRQCTSCSLDIHQQMFQCKHELRASCCSDLSTQASLLYDHLSPQLQRAFDAASEQGHLVG